MEVRINENQATDNSSKNYFPKEPVSQIDKKILRLKPSQISKMEGFAKIFKAKSR